MLLDIQPASDVLWGAEEPLDDQAWKTLEQAAQTMISVSDDILNPGSGPNDSSWVNDSEWKSLAAEMKDAAGLAMKAVRARDVDAVLDAGDLLYLPCDSCHKKFNPAVINQSQSR
jgi:cytochrome c556